MKKKYCQKTQHNHQQQKHKTQSVSDELQCVLSEVGVEVAIKPHLTT